MAFNVTSSRLHVIECEEHFRSTFTTSWHIETWKHMICLVILGGTVSDNIWNKCWIVSVDAVWLTSELLTNQWLPAILLLLSEPESIRMSVSEGAVTHLLRSHFLCLINIQEGWRLTNKLKTWISLQLSSKYFSCKVCVLAKALFWKNTLHVYAFRYNQKLGSFIVFLHRGLLGANRKSVTMTCLSHMKH